MHVLCSLPLNIIATQHRTEIGRVARHSAASVVDPFLYLLRQLPLPPGPWVLPYIGDTIKLIYEGLIKISTDRQAIYGPIHRTWILGERNVFVADAASVRKVLNGEHTIAEGVSCCHCMYIAG